MSLTVIRKMSSKDRQGSATRLSKSNSFMEKMVTFKSELCHLTKSIPSVKITAQDSSKGSKVFRIDDNSRVSEQSKDDRKYIPLVSIILESAMKQNMKVFEWKYYELTLDYLKFLISFLSPFDTITTLRLEYCHIESEGILHIGEYLTANPNVAELSLNGNPIEENVSALLKENNLKYLSLKFCKISHLSVDELLSGIKSPFAHPLLHLNLSSNFLGDQGLSKIADVLRINRTLLSLNVADNCITDAGLETFLIVFRTFAMDINEISMRRKIYYDFYMKKYELSKPFPEGGSSLIKKSSSSSSKRRRSSKMKMQSRKSNKSASSVASAKSSKTSSLSKLGTARHKERRINSKESELESIGDLSALLDYESYENPFVKDCYAVETELFCNGNFRLSHLNISYNKLTKYSLGSISSILRYQNEKGTPDDGLATIVFYGNNWKLDEDAIEFQKISELLSVKSIVVAPETNKEPLKRRRSNSSK